MKALLPLFITSTLFLSACEQGNTDVPAASEAATSAAQSSHEGHEGHEGHLHHGHDNADITTVTYDCDNGESIQAQYDNRTQDSVAILTINEKTYSLYQVISASGARYASEKGIQADEGIQWLTKGKEAVLTNLVLDHTAPPEDTTVLFRCEEQNAAQSEPVPQ
jgi:membrane-bound inhibitor of C-type lysozyme